MLHNVDGLNFAVINVILWHREIWNLIGKMQGILLPEMSRNHLWYVQCPSPLKIFWAIHFKLDIHRVPPHIITCKVAWSAKLWTYYYLQTFLKWSVLGPGQTNFKKDQHKIFGCQPWIFCFLVTMNDQDRKIIWITFQKSSCKTKKSFFFWQVCNFMTFQTLNCFEVIKYAFCF